MKFEQYVFVKLFEERFGEVLNQSINERFFIVEMYWRKWKNVYCKRPEPKKSGYVVISEYYKDLQLWEYHTTKDIKEYILAIR